MVSIIAAMATNGVIGKDNGLIWRIPQDLKRFKALTLGHTIIMGRKTFESLPGVLPGRKHVIITRNPQYPIDHEAVFVASNLHETLQESKQSGDEFFIIGGGEIYKQAMPYCNKLYLTHVGEAFEGDTYFPPIPDSFSLVKQSEVYQEPKSGLSFQFQDWERP